MSPARALRRRLDPARAGERLDAFLLAWLPQALGRPLTRSDVRRLVMAGAVLVDGRVRRQAGLRLWAGAGLEARVDPERLGPSVTPAAFVFDARRVLLECDGLLAVDKPPGLPLHATADPRRPHLVGALLAWLAARATEAAPAPYLGVHQRLDRDTSGVVLFATRPDVNPGLARQFEERTVEKVYWALSERLTRVPPRSWSATQSLGRVGRGRMGALDPQAGGLAARTDFRLLQAGTRRLLIEARPRTGRQHQIRVHLALLGLPIVGDHVYGSARPDAPRLMLHAASLTLRHPATGAPLRIESPLPADFREALAASLPARTRRG